MFDFILKAIGIFIAALLGDIVWALYVKKIAEYKRLSGAIYATLIGVFFLINLEILIKNMYYGIFYLAGLFIGTYWHQEIENYFLKLWNKTKDKFVKKI